MFAEGVVRIGVRAGEEGGGGGGCSPPSYGNYIIFRAERS